MAKHSIHSRPYAVWTIGHSTRSADVLIALLEAHGVNHLVDIRTYPRSRTNPQFNRDTLPGELAEAGIDYTHMEGLGGLRHARKDSENSGWENTGFRGYADYMQTEEFDRHRTELIALAGVSRVAIMCAEAVPWRCHRLLVSDALVVRGLEVKHIMTEKRAQPHKLTSFARVAGEKITYPAAPQEPHPR